MEAHRPRNIFMDLLVIMFGVSAWIGITGIYLQLPQLVQTLPEGWNLPSYIVILTQCGNIASLIYMIYVKWCPVKIDDIYLIYFTLGIGTLAALLMVFYCQDTIVIGGQSRSIPLLIFTAMFAFVGCLSSVLFMPFMGRFRGIYLVTYMFGQGLNGLISSLLSLIQGVGTVQCDKNNATFATSVTSTTSSEPLFQPGVFFLFIFGIFVLSIIAFVLMNKMELCKMELTSTQHVTFENPPENGGNDANGYQSISAHGSSISSTTFYYLMFVIGVVSFLMYSFLPGIQSYSCLSYGVSAYHMSTTLSSIANPLGCLFSLYFTRPIVSDITTLFGTGFLLAIYILVTAVQSPTSPFYTTQFGYYLIITVWTVFTGLATFTKLSILQLFRSYDPKALKWAGGAIQLSSCFGAIVVFLLVNETSIFINYDPCKN